MPRGRRPKPTALRVLEGNRSKRPLPAFEPTPEVAAPECPPHLKGEARAEWDRITEELEKLGMVSRLERGALAAYCQCWARWVDAEEKLEQFGLLVRSPNGYPMPSPYVAIANKAMDQMRAFLIEFGMTPASRTKVADARRAPPKNPFARNGRLSAVK